MAISPEMQELLTGVRQEIENIICSPPGWAFDRVKDELVGALLKSALNHKWTQTVGKAIAEEFGQAIILKVAEEFRRIVAGEVASAIRSLSYEMAEIRAVIRRDIDNEDWWKQGPADSSEPGGDEEPPGL